MALDEISFASEEAWGDIYAWRKGHKRAICDPAFAVAPEGQVDNLISTSNAKFHARVRELTTAAFTEESLHAQFPLIEGHADMLISQLQWNAEANQDLVAQVNLTDWISFFAMDVIRDLAFGEDFGCLVKGDYHDWVRTLYYYLSAMTIAAAPRYWPTAAFLFEKMIPQKVTEGQRRHQNYANEKINRRLHSDSQRPNFMTPFMKSNPE